MQIVLPTVIIKLVAIVLQKASELAVHVWNSNIENLFVFDLFWKFTHFSNAIKWKGVHLQFCFQIHPYHFWADSDRTFDSQRALGCWASENAILRQLLEKIQNPQSEIGKNRKKESAYNENGLVVEVIILVELSIGRSNCRFGFDLFRSQKIILVLLGQIHKIRRSSVVGNRTGIEQGFLRISNLQFFSKIMHFVGYKFVLKT